MAKNINLKAKLDRVFSEFIRRRDCIKAGNKGFIRCYCCGKMIEWRKSQCMHYIPRQHIATRFNEINCNAGCVHCNYYMNGNIEEYVLHLQKEHGDEIINKLAIAKKSTSKISEFEYGIMINEYKNKIKELKVIMND